MQPYRPDRWRNGWLGSELKKSKENILVYLPINSKPNWDGRLKNLRANTSLLSISEIDA